MANPMYEFDFAGAWEDFIGPRRRRVRQVLLVQGAGAAHPLVARRLHRLARLAVQLCARTRATSPTTAKTTGSWYLDACGPVGHRAAPYGQWTGNDYSAGIAQIDTRHLRLVRGVDHRPQRAHRRRGATPTLPQYVQAAHQWQSVDPENMEERALVFVYHTCRNMRHEAEENGLTYDQPHKYQDLDANSVARTSSQFLYDTYALRNRTLARTYAHLRAHKVTPRVFTALPRGRCRRFKYEIFTDRRPVDAQAWATSSTRAATDKVEVQEGEDQVPEHVRRHRRLRSTSTTLPPSSAAPS